MNDARWRNGALHWLALAGVLALTAVLYAPAFTAGFSLDDNANLLGLTALETRDDILRFIFDGDAGPLGRAIALASFVPQAAEYQEGAGAFIRVNLLIHLLNGLLIAFLAGRVAALAGLAEGSRRFAIIAATAIWLWLPILAPASLMVVQRMTTLSTTFMLAGIAGYLLARRDIDTAPVRAMSLMAVAAGLGTLLAVLTKESGALLPLYLLVLEVTLLPRPTAAPAGHWRLFRAVVLGLPTLVIAGWLLTRVPYSEALVARRGFTAAERLITEAGLLWRYLFDAFLPLPGSISPINDTVPVVRSPWSFATLLAIVGWIGVIGAAIVNRRQRPLFAFAVLWYLGGHLLESTLLGLELRFDHRNYLPLVGPVIGLVIAALRLPMPQRALRAGLGVYALLLAASLWSLTSLWGNPAQAARYWHQKHPDSVRAASMVMSQQLAEGRIDDALRQLREFVAANPEHAYLRIQDLNIQCRLQPDFDFAPQATGLRSALQNVEFTYTAGTMLSELINVSAQRNCRGLDAPTLRALTDALRDNPRYRLDRRYGAMHHKLRALTWRIEGDLDKALVELRESAQLRYDREIVTLQVITLAEAGRFDEAAGVLHEARNFRTWHPVRNRLWQQMCEELAAWLKALQQGRGETDND